MLFATALLAQPTVYNDATTLVTGTWVGNGTLTEVTGNSPQEGVRHYGFTYNYTGFWAGFGLNLSNWGSNPTYNFSNYTHVRVSYRGLSSGEGLSLTLRSVGDVAGNVVSVGSTTGQYTTVDVPLLALQAGTSLNLSAVTELMFSVSSNTAVGSGTVYIDNIQLVSTTTTMVPTSAATWQRAQQMHRGVNLSNWLEAYWLIPFNAYPETNKYNAATFTNLSALGVDAFRLPITFEHLAASTPPYTLNTAHPAFALIDNAIQWAATSGVKLIIDMHHGTTTLTDANYATELPRLRAIWQQVIARYGHLDPGQYFFEVYNEPHAISNANFRTVAQALVDDLRTAGAAHSVIVGASGYNGAGSLAAFTPLNDADIIYTFHFYDPYFFTHQQMSWTSPPNFAARTFPQAGELASVASVINAAGDWAAVHNVPVVVGEFGVSADADATSKCNWINTIVGLFDDNAFPWFYWDPLGYNDGFGFFANGVIDETTIVPCFSTTMGLQGAVLAIAELSPLRVACDGHSRIIDWYLVTDEPAHVTVEAYQPQRKQWVQVGQLDVLPIQRRYTFRTDVDAPYYRLKITELDGRITYSDVAENKCPPAGEWKVYPNPAVSGTTVYLESPIDGAADVLLYDALGRVVFQQTDLERTPMSAIQLNLPTLPAGVYGLQIRTALGVEAFVSLVLE